MSRPKQRISVSGSQGGMPGAFSALDIPGLPEPAEDAAGMAPDGGQVSAAGSPGRVVLSRLKAHRAGKVVIAIGGFDARVADGQIADLARRLRAHCGCGGTVVGRVVEIQGDQVSRVRVFLESEGFKVDGVK